MRCVYDSENIPCPITPPPRNAGTSKEEPKFSTEHWKLPTRVCRFNSSPQLRAILPFRVFPAKTFRRRSFSSASGGMQAVAFKGRELSSSVELRGVHRFCSLCGSRLPRECITRGHACVRGVFPASYALESPPKHYANGNEALNSYRPPRRCVGFGGPFY